MVITEYTEIKCPRCQRAWMHRGKLEWATCPSCRKLFKKDNIPVGNNRSPMQYGGDERSSARHTQDTEKIK